MTLQLFHTLSRPFHSYTEVSIDFPIFLLPLQPNSSFYQLFDYQIAPLTESLLLLRRITGRISILTPFFQQHIWLAPFVNAFCETLPRYRLTLIQRKQPQSRFPKLLDPRFGKGRRILFCPLPPAALPSHRDTCNCTHRKRNHPQLPRGQYVQVVLS